MSQPKLDRDKPFGTIYSMGDSNRAYTQFGCYFDENGNFVEHVEGYDPKVHGEKKPKRKTKAKGRIRKTVQESTVTVGRDRAKAAADAERSRSQEASDAAELNAQLNG